LVLPKALKDLKDQAWNNRQAFRSVAALSGGNTLSAILGVLGSLLVARFIGPEVNGLYRSFTIPMMYLTFLHLGTFDGLWRQIPFYTGQGKPEKVEALASSAGAWNVIASSAVSVGFLICALYSLWNHDWYGVVGWSTQALLCWGVLYSGYVSAIYRTLSEFISLARIQLMQSVMNFVLIILLPFLQFFGLCIRAAVSTVAGVWLLHDSRPLKVRYKLDLKALGEVLKVGLPLSLWGNLNTSIWVAAENSLILYFGGVTHLGLFTAAYALREGINIVPIAINQVLMPRIVEGFARDESVRNANAKTAWLTVALTAAMTLIILVLMLLLDELVPILIPKYVEGLPLMRLCLWFGVVQTAALPLNTLFATGKSWLFGRGVLAGMLAFLVSAYLLTPSLGGPIAVVTGSLIGRAVRTIAAYVDIFLLIRREAR
jgi:O-antigen/teichoic acid export membrane protein